MKSFTPTLIFAAVVAAMGGFAYWDWQRQQVNEQKLFESEKLLPDWSEATVNELKLVSPTNEVHLKKENGKWQVLKPVMDEADNSAVAGLISSIIADNVKALEIQGEANLGQYGLSTAKKFVELVRADSSKKRIEVSDKKAYDGQNYIRFSDGKNILLASSSWDSWLGRSANDLRDKNLFKRTEPLKKVTFKGKKSLVFINESGNWKLEGQPNFELDSSKLEGVLTSIKNFRASEVVSENQNKDSMKRFGLTQPGSEVIVEFESGEPMKFFVAPVKEKESETYLYTNTKPFIYKTYKSVVEKWNLALKDVEKEKPKDTPAEPSAKKE